MVAWQRDGVGHGQESVTLIGYDADGLSEAVGSFYEAVAGLDPLTKWTLPVKDSLSTTHKVPNALALSGFKVVWSAHLPDRITGLKAEKRTLTALSHDGTLATIGADGKMTGSKVIEPGQLAALEKELATRTATDPDPKNRPHPTRMLKLTATSGASLAVAYWGGRVRVEEGGRVQGEHMLPQDVTALAWLDGRLVAGLADGRVMLLEMK
jgi:hypothetical protein